MKTTNEHFIQVGITALRGPTGAFLPAVPIYIKVSQEHTPKKGKMPDVEQNLVADISGIFAEKFRQYVQAANKGV